MFSSMNIYSFGSVVVPNPLANPIVLYSLFSNFLSISNPWLFVSWEWDFDNDGTIDATTQNPGWQYTNFGIYTVTLTVSDGTNFDSETKIDYITVTDPNQVTDSLFCDSFENGIGLWTIINNGGTCDWEIFTPPYPNDYTLPPATVPVNEVSSTGIM